MPTIGERVARLEEKVDSVIDKQNDTHAIVKSTKELILGNGKTGLFTRIDRLERKDKMFTKIAYIVFAAVVGLSLTMLFSCGTAAFTHDYNIKLSWEQYDMQYEQNKDTDRLNIYELNADSTIYSYIISVSPRDTSFNFYKQANDDTLYIAMTAVDSTGNESEFSNIAKTYLKKLDMIAPKPPKLKPIEKYIEI